jgi:hypothetical protein
MTMQDISINREKDKTVQTITKWDKPGLRWDNALQIRTKQDTGTKRNKVGLSGTKQYKAG